MWAKHLEFRTHKPEDTHLRSSAPLSSNFCTPEQPAAIPQMSQSQRRQKRQMHWLLALTGFWPGGAMEKWRDSINAPGHPDSKDSSAGLQWNARGKWESHKVALNRA